MTEQPENFDVELEKILRIVIRRRWCVLLPAMVIGVCASLVSLLLPNYFESQAVILVESQQVPERYVTANTITDMREVLVLMTDAVLSRTRLLQIINDFDLYPRERKTMAPEQLVWLMRSNIEIVPTQKGSEEPRGSNAFKITFTGNDPHSAQAVTGRLTDLFIKENNQSREEQSTGTTKFLADELVSAEEALNQQDIRVRDFKMHNLGELPDQQPGNLAILSGLHEQLQNVQASLGRAREQDAYLQSLISQYREIAAANVPVSGPVVSAPVETMKAELSRLQAERFELMGRYTEKYPDVVKIDQEIQQTQQLLATATASKPTPSKGGNDQQNSKTTDPTRKDAAVAQLNSQLEANRIEKENDLAEEKRLESQIDVYEHRLNLTPVREEQLAELMRGYDEAKRHYDELLSKKKDSEMATSLIRRQQGQRFRIIDPPSLPEVPSNKGRLKISLGGLAAGLGVGIGLAFLLESRNHSFREEGEMRRMFGFPLLLGVPLKLSKIEEKRRSRLAALEWVGGVLVCLLIAASEALVYLRS